MYKWALAFLAVFCAYAIYSGDAVQCFECNSSSDPSCGDPFYTNRSPIDCDRRNPYQPQSQSYQGGSGGSVCKKTKTRVNGYYVVDRSCAYETYGADPCGGSRNYGYRDSNQQYQQSSYPTSNYGNNYGSNQYGSNNYGSNNYGSNNYGANNYGNSYGSNYNGEHCSVCYTNYCNGATGVVPTFWALGISMVSLVAMKRV